MSGNTMVLYYMSGNTMVLYHGVWLHYGVIQWSLVTLWCYTIVSGNTMVLYIYIFLTLLFTLVVHSLPC